MIKKLKIYEDFKKIIEIFQEPPFYEIQTDEDIKNEYEMYVNDKNGGAFSYYNNNEILGINCFTYGAEENHGIIFPEDSKIVYISGMATMPDARGLGIGTKLLEHTIKHFEELNKFDYMYLRTNLEGSMSSGIAKKHGFITLQKNNNIYTQSVKFERNDPTVDEVDLRKFMVKTMNNNYNISDIKIK